LTAAVASASKPASSASSIGSGSGLISLITDKK
jgi:hypothetical protein